MFFQKFNKKGRNPCGNLSCFSRRPSQKKGDVGVEEVAKWLLYMGVLAVAIIAVVKIIGNFK